MPSWFFVGAKKKKNKQPRRKKNTVNAVGGAVCPGRAGGGARKCQGCKKPPPWMSVGTREKNKRRHTRLPVDAEFGQNGNSGGDPSFNRNKGGPGKIRGRRGRDFFWGGGQGGCGPGETPPKGSGLGGGGGGVPGGGGALLRFFFFFLQAILFSVFWLFSNTPAAHRWFFLGRRVP